MLKIIGPKQWPSAFVLTVFLISYSILSKFEDIRQFRYLKTRGGTYVVPLSTICTVFLEGITSDEDSSGLVPDPRPNQDQERANLFIFVE